MARFDGKVVLISGGARGQGRSHAVHFAREGADIVIFDICRDIEVIPYPLATRHDLDTTVREVEKLDRRCLSMQADVRDSAQVRDVVTAAIAEFGRVDICLANAGIQSFGSAAELSDESWQTAIDINLTGVFNTIRAVLPYMIEQKYGRVIATASMAGKRGFGNVGHYVASKWGVIGLIKCIALEVGADGITVNAICPTNTNTPMIRNEATYKLFAPELEHPGADDVTDIMRQFNAIPIPWVEAEDISNAALFLASDEARYITGETIAVAAGQNANMAG
jgi:SDR family mycofactocin-dependent oxidoreductase